LNISFKKKSVAFSWLISYISILIVPIIISIVIFIQSDKVLQNEINQAQLNILQQVQELMDVRLRDARNLTVQIGLNPDILSLIYKNKPLQSSDNITIQRVIKQLTAYKQANPFIDNFYIYLKNSNTCLTPSTHINGRFLFEHIHEKSNTIKYEDWLRIVRDTPSSKYITITQQMGELNPQRAIAYIQPIPLESRNNSSATAVIMMNESRFNEVLQTVQWKNTGNIFIIDSDNNIVASNERIQLPEFLSYKDLPKSRDILYRNQNGKALVITYTTSRINNWKYISITSMNNFIENAVYIRNLIIFGTALCFFLGILLISLLLKKNYNVVHELVTSVSQKSGLPVSEEVNEFKFISEVLSTTITKHNKTIEKLERQSVLLRAHFLSKLLKGKTTVGINIDDSLNSFNINFISKNFAVLLISIEDYSEFFPEEDKTPEPEKLKLVNFIFTNVIEELCNINNMGIMVEMDDMLACLVNIDDNQLKIGKEVLTSIANKALNFITKNFNIDFTVAISNIHYDISSIPIAYHESLDAMEYKIIMENSKIIHYDNIKNSNHHYNYSYETEYQLTNLIKAGDFDNAKILLNQIFEDNFYKEEHISLQLAKCLLFDLVSTMLKTIDQIENILDKSFIDALSPATLLLECKTVKEMHSQMEYILQQVCDYINKQRKSENNRLSHEVINFIENNYNDINMNISSLGDHFNLTPSYLSKLFKEQTNENLSDCINKIRLKKAKELLTFTNNNIEQIALDTGYTSSAVFIRTFKKYEGITPGKFRTLNSKNKE